MLENETETIEEVGPVAPNEDEPYVEFSDIGEDGKLRNFEQLFSKPENQEKTAKEPENQETEEKNEITPESQEKTEVEENVLPDLETFSSPESAMEFYTQSKTEEIKPPVTEPEKPDVVSGATEEKPEEKLSHSEQIMNNFQQVLTLMDKIHNTYGENWETTKRLAEDQFQRIANDHQRDMEFQDFKNSISEKEKAIAMREKVVDSKHAYNENLFNAAKSMKWGNTTTLQNAMFNKDLGLNFLTWQFKKDNPDASYNSVEEWNKAFSDWMTVFGADKSNTAFIEEYTRLKLMAKNSTKYAKILAEKEKKQQAELSKGNSLKVKGDKSVTFEKSASNGLKDWLSK